MTRIARIVVAAIGVLALLASGTSALETTERAARASLKVTPGVYVAGQKMTFTGYIGARGKRKVHLQFHMNRPGDRWTDVKGSSDRTNAKGRFRFTFPAPAMWGVSYRVVSGRLHTPGYKFHARGQESVLSTGGDVVAGTPFTMTVDTTPVFPGRQDLPPPAIPGRTVTLQQRVNGDQWRTVGRTTTDSSGVARFPALTVADPGVVVYRARQENWTKNGDRIGWHPSYPTYVDVRSTPRPAPRTAGSERAPAWAPMLRGDKAGPTASSRYGWGSSLWDFAWEYGESLSSRPYRGTDRKGSWVDASNGTGRASHVNGGLGLDSSQNASGKDPDRGTTYATMRGNPAKYGRWEVRSRSWVRGGSTSGDYHVKIELVPDRNPDCGAQTITVADYRIHSRKVSVGVNAKNKKSWRRTKGGVSLADIAHNYAVEVARDHITWFLDAKPIATVKNKKAIPGVPLTLRLTLQGDGNKEMNRTRAMFDWQRSWNLKKGKKVKSGNKMKTSRHNATC